MAEFPVLVPTSIGFLGGIVSEPDAAPTTAVVFLPGWGGSRWGTNRVWSRLARGLTDLGALVLRVDFPGWWDSDPAPPGNRPLEGGPLRAAREAVAWFRERAGDVDLILMGACYGGRVAVELAAEEPDVRGVAFIAPYFKGAPSPATNAARRLLGPALRPVLGTVRGALGNGRYGRLRERMVAPANPEIKHLLVDAAQRAPLWILVGEYDDAAGDLDWITSDLPAGADIAVETVPGTEIHTYGARVAQEETIARAIAWAQSRIGERLKA